MVQGEDASPVLTSWSRIICYLNLRFYLSNQLQSPFDLAEYKLLHHKWYHILV